MKAIITLDLPDDIDIRSACAIVDIADKNDNEVCTAQKVKPMPSEMEDGVETSDSEWMSVPFNHGWNACLQQINRSYLDESDFID